MAVIAVVGGSECSQRESALAREVGRRIAEAGDTLVCGGRTGVMEAACEGARSAGGMTVGILPGSDPREANDFVAVAIPTGLGLARNTVIAAAADAVIAVGGGYGTLSEIAFALNVGKRVICLESWDIGLCGRRTDRFFRASSPEEAVRMARLTSGTGR